MSGDVPPGDGRGERLFAGYSGRMFLVVTLGVGTVKIGKDVLPPLLPTIIEELSLTPVEAGFALSVMAAFFSVVQYPSGRLADRLSRKTVLMVSMVVVIAGLALLANATTYGLFLLAVVILGLGRGLYPTAARAMLSDLFLDRRGRAFGIHMAAGDISGTAAAGLAVVVLAVASWRSAFLPVIVVLVPLLLLLQRWSREPLVFKAVPLGVRATGARVFRDRRMRRLVVAYVLFIFTIRGFIGFLPVFLQAEHGFSAPLASGAFALLFASGLVIKPAAGLTSDYTNRPLVGAVVLLIGAVGAAILVVSSTVWITFAGLLVYAVGHKAFGPVMQAYLMDTFPDASMGGDLGAVRTVYMTLGSVGPTYVGFVAGVYDYSAAFAGFSACMLVAGGITLWLALTG